MLNKTKALGLAFIAVVAMSALTASAASASSIDLTKVPATITGTTSATHQTVFKLPLTVGEPLQLLCTTQSLEATIQATPAQEVTATGTYTNCLLNGLNTVVRMNGCKYTVTGAGQATVGTATVDVAGCTEGKQIEIEITPTKCVISIPAQTTVGGHVVFTQQGNDATMDITTEKITNKQGPVGCPNLNCEQQNATFTGSTTIQAFEDQGLDEEKLLHGHKYKASKHNGVEVKLTVT